MNKLGLDHGQVVSEFAFYDPEDYNFLFKNCLKMVGVEVPKAYKLASYQY